MRAAVGAERVERAAHDVRRRHREPAQALRPRRDGALGDHLAHDGHELQRLRREVVAPPGARPEALHDLVERAEAHARAPSSRGGPAPARRGPTAARCCSARARAASGSPRGGARRRVEPAVLGVEELEHLPVLVDDDDAAARPRRLAVRRRARLPEAQEADPVLRRPALEAHVGGEHGARA